MRRKPTGRSATTSKPSIFQSPMFNLFTIAIMGGVLILGIGIGIAFSSQPR